METFSRRGVRHFSNSWPERVKRGLARSPNIAVQKMFLLSILGIWPVSAANSVIAGIVQFYSKQLIKSRPFKSHSIALE
jgi:hypothetical protein